MQGIVIHKGDNCDFLPVFEPVAKRAAEVKQTLFFDKPVHIVAANAVVGNKEAKGPLKRYFRRVKEDIKLGEKNFERAEILMFDEAVRASVREAKESVGEVQLLISGDLLNQMTTSSYVARNLDLPHLGVYSACSTYTEAISIAATMLNAGHFQTVACATASHFATAERQFRYPLEYGCQRPPYAQWTVTAAGCCVLSTLGSGPLVRSATLGKVVDFGQNDLSNMGAAMAPAAMDTMCALFKETETGPEDYDMILTGDLGKLGSDILRDLMREQGYDLGQRYSDCGSLIYSVDQNCYQGGSGAGCSASVINEFIIPRIKEGEYKKVAYLATGALMSTQSCYQGETIPGVSHGIVIEGERK